MVGRVDMLSAATRVEPKSDLSIHWVEVKEMSTQSNNFKV